MGIGRRRRIRGRFLGWRGRCLMRWRGRRLRRRGRGWGAGRGGCAGAGLADGITNDVGDADVGVKRIGGGIDIAFIDADKPRCLECFEMVWPKIRVGGSVMTDNATTHRSELAEFVGYLRSLVDASSVEVAVGNGIEWTIKQK